MRMLLLLLLFRSGVICVFCMNSCLHAYRKHRTPPAVAAGIVVTICGRLLKG